MGAKTRARTTEIPAKALYSLKTVAAIGALVEIMDRRGLIEPGEIGRTINRVGAGLDQYLAQKRDAEGGDE